jgi:UDP-2,3-diacylglucosamine pyrophosphatase LpxH
MRADGGESRDYFCEAGKGSRIEQNKPVFVISDLHIGDRSGRDNLGRAHRESLLDSFLRHIEHQRGQLVIVGDFLELLRYPLDSIIDRRGTLLDRLAGMDTVYVPGNHDEEVMRWADAENPPHPFFARISPAFVRRIGDRRFKFMHGHEVDPLAHAGIQNLGRMIGSLAYLCEFGPGACLLSNDALIGVLEEAGEQLLRVWSWLRAGMNTALRESYDLLPAGRMRFLVRRIRTQRMLTRYYQDKTEGLYDIAIVGHTHKAGTFGDWYFNSGSWTGASNNFLRIAPDGEVGVFNWTDSGPQPNGTVVA